jgi:uncharacterized membrane protein YdjX (TVP38/TMEM64 family)
MSKGILFVLIVFISIFAFFYGRNIPMDSTILWANQLKSSELKVPVFIGISIVICFVNIPLGVLTKVASGWLFGFSQGLIISYFSILLGSWMAFRLSRFLGKEFVERFFGKNINKLNARLKDKQLLRLVQVRVFPFIPLPAANFGLGITDITNLNFILSSAIGMLPATIFYSYIGAQLNDLTLASLNFQYFIPYYVYIFLALLASLCLPFIVRYFEKKTIT